MEGELLPLQHLVLDPLGAWLKYIGIVHNYKKQYERGGASLQTAGLAAGPRRR